MQCAATWASGSSWVKRDICPVNKSLKGFFQRRSSLRSAEKLRYSLRPGEPPILSFIYVLLNYFMNRALCFMAGILPCASLSLYKPRGPALICSPTAPGFENVYTRKKERGRKKRKEIKAQSEFTSVSLSEHWYDGLFSFAVLTPSPQVLGLMGDWFSPFDCVNEEAVDSHGTGKTYVLHYLDSLYCFSLSLLAGNMQPWAVPIFKMHFFSAPDYCQVEI